MSIESKLNIMDSGVIAKSPIFCDEKYSIFKIERATGVLYITANSPQYLSGHLRLRGRDNGSYPYGYTELIDELFGKPSLQQRTVEVCSGTVSASDQLVTVDLNPAKNPSHVGDGQKLPISWSSIFNRWRCDPPYHDTAAEKRYGTALPSFSKLLTEGARVVKPGGLLFLLLGNTNYQWHPPCLTRIGLIFITIVPNNEVRCLNVYLKS
jgi:hypothetical protein